MKNAQITKQDWIDMFREIGLDDDRMRQWHRLFESRHPDAHAQFLQWLGVDASDIEQIRAGSR